MRYQKIDPKLFIENRARFCNHMQAWSLAVFNSNDIFVTSADSTLPFKQHSDIFYLSGVDQEASILVLFPDAKEAKHREILFLKETSELIKIWEGEKLTKQAAFEVSGVKTVYWLSEFDAVFKVLVEEAQNIYLNPNRHARANTEAQTREDRFILSCKQKYTSKNFLESGPILYTLRASKSEIELRLMQTACDITEHGFKRILNVIEPGIAEYEIEAELAHEFIRNRANGFAYTPIIASGKNACILHYIQNNQVCNAGDLILMDFGANYANYCADLTRCAPVNGKFSPRQKQVYNAVLHVKKEATKLLKPGIILAEYQKEVGLIMQDQLLQIGLLDKVDIQNQDPKNPAYKKYFMHGCSHFIGLDTHDVGHWDKPIEAGMCFTVEPGIYIWEEGLGIRLEDNVVVQEQGEPFNLMQNIPVEIEEIEDLMQP